MRYADDRALHHARKPVDLALHLLGIDVVAAADDEILAAAQDMDIAALIDLAEIAGDEEAVGTELGRGLLGIAPIALEDVRPLDLDHPGLAAGQLAPALRLADPE